MAGSPGAGSVLVVIPTYNECATIGQVLDKALAAGPRISVLVVDDASPDETGDVVEEYGGRHERVHLLRREGKLGLGSAYRAGLRWGLARDWDVLCEMDADLSHDPADLVRLLEAVDHGAALALGSRYVPGGRVDGWSRRRLALSVLANSYVRVLTGCPVRDATSGFRAYRRDILARIHVPSVRSEGYAFQVEMLLRCWQIGAAVEEVPITFSERIAGVSKINRRIILEAFWRVLGWGWTIRRGRSLLPEGDAATRIAATQVADEDRLSSD